MPLPKLAVPEYECTLPVSGTKVSYRPFLVKEEKLLYIAMESQDEKEMIKVSFTEIHRSESGTQFQSKFYRFPHLQLLRPQLF